MTDPSRPLSPMAARFAAVWAGDSTRAAELAGYSGTRPSLATIGSRLYRDPRVQAVIAARRAGAHVPPAEPQAAPTTPPGAPEAPAGAEAHTGPADAGVDDGEGGSPLEILRALARDPTTHPSARVQAAKAVAALERAAAGEGVDVLSRQRERATEIMLATRAREAETGCCSRCGQRLARSNR